MGIIIPPTEASNGLPESDASLLNQIQQQHIPACKFLRHFDNPAQSQVGQLLAGAFIAGKQLLGKLYLISKGLNPGKLLQIQPQRIVLFHVCELQTVLHILPFLLEPLGQLSIGDRSGEGGKIHDQVFFRNRTKSILYGIIILILQHGQQIPRRNRRTG